MDPARVGRYVDKLGHLVELNGLRKRLAHEYDPLIDERALSSGERLAEEPPAAIEEVRKWISSQA